MHRKCCGHDKRRIGRDDDVLFRAVDFKICGKLFRPHGAHLVFDDQPLVAVDAQKKRVRPIGQDLKQKEFFFLVPKAQVEHRIHFTMKSLASVVLKRPRPRRHALPSAVPETERHSVEKTDPTDGEHGKEQHDGPRRSQPAAKILEH